jgi:hypothetical protein
MSRRWTSVSSGLERSPYSVREGSENSRQDVAKMSGKLASLFPTGAVSDLVAALLSNWSLDYGA